MKIKFHKIILGMLLVAGTSLTAHAQSDDVSDGRMWTAFNGRFSDQMKSAGVKAAFLDFGRTPSNKGFQVSSGQIDLISGLGDVQTSGLIRFKQSGREIDASLLELDVTGTGTVVTAIVALNSVVVGRQVIFDFPGAPGLLQPNDGAIDSGVVSFVIDPVFWTEFATFFQVETPMPTGSSGEVRLLATVAPVTAN